MGQRTFAMIYVLRRDLLSGRNTNAAIASLQNKTRQAFNRTVGNFRDTFCRVSKRRDARRRNEDKMPRRTTDLDVIKQAAEGSQELHAQGRLAEAQRSRCKTSSRSRRHGNAVSD
jgi:hypothetical protein